MGRAYRRHRRELEHLPVAVGEEAEAFAAGDGADAFGVDVEEVDVAFGIEQEFGTAREKGDIVKTEPGEVEQPRIDREMNKGIAAGAFPREDPKRATQPGLAPCLQVVAIGAAEGLPPVRGIRIRPGGYPAVNKWPVCTVCFGGEFKIESRGDGGGKGWSAEMRLEIEAGFIFGPDEGGEAQVAESGRRGLVQPLVGFEVEEFEEVPVFGN